ncbi:hypothetical protein N7540_008563 [Penicillium herquei]|nr:hypothetical protein N7540_008563 [Penicillium herquei]
MTAADFTHEFRMVHAAETRSVATNLGIILQYIQGLALPTLDKPGLSNLPLEEGSQYQSFARLTWPSVEVMQGSFSTDDYRRSAGKHIFATPFRMLLTECIEPPSSINSDTGSPIASSTAQQDVYSIRLIITVFPNSVLSRAKFEEEWGRHTAWTHSLNIQYTRYAVISLDRERIQRIFDQTPFDPLLVADAGGYDEFLFASHDEATAFLEKYSSQLRSSYKRFVDPIQSFAYAFDELEQFGSADRGLWQKTMGLLVGSLLRFKVYYNV